jgi:hypothetical protein
MVILKSRNTVVVLNGETGAHTNGLIPLQLFTNGLIPLQLFLSLFSLYYAGTAQVVKSINKLVRS